MIEQFHAVDWMRRRRTEIDAEDDGLSWQERSTKTEMTLANDPKCQDFRRRIPALRADVSRATGTAKH